MYMLAVSLVSPAPQQRCPGLSVCLEPLEYAPLLHSGETHPLSGGDRECCTNNSQTCSNTVCTCVIMTVQFLYHTIILLYLQQCMQDCYRQKCQQRVMASTLYTSSYSRASTAIILILICPLCIKCRVYHEMYCTSRSSLLSFVFFYAIHYIPF